MKKFLFTLLMLWPSTSFACNGYVIGFKGIHNRFDEQAFQYYAKQRGFCGKSFSWPDTKTAIKFVQSKGLPYELYGYSQGASSVRRVLETRALPGPRYVITIGAWRTANINFDKFNVPYKNFYDNSGINLNRKEPKNKYMNVPHTVIQRRVNEYLFGRLAQ